MVRVDNRNLKKAVIQSSAFQKKARRDIELRVARAQQQMLDSFDNHPVTAEILDGPDAPNRSGTLGGEGNLFSFIGFESNSSPIGSLRTALQYVRILRLGTLGNKALSFRIDLASEGLIRRATPLPYLRGQSWAEGIEEGIDNFNSFLAGKFGRSGGGIQSRSPIRATHFQPVPYVSQIYQIFRSALQNARTPLA